MNCVNQCFGPYQHIPLMKQLGPLFIRDSMMLYTGESNVSAKLRSSILLHFTSFPVTGSLYLTGKLP